MTDQELKRMNRGDLIEIIYQYQTREQEYMQKLADLTAQLEDRRSKIAEAGSIAEAALSVNRVFEAAQAAADQYVAEVRAANADKEKQVQQMLSEASARADAIRQQAEQEADAMREKAQQDCDVMRSKITELLKNYEELRGLLPR